MGLLSVRARYARINRHMLKCLGYVCWAGSGSDSGTDMHRDFFEIPRGGQQGQSQHGAFAQADCIAGPDGALGAFGNQLLKRPVERGGRRRSAVHMCVAKHFAAHGIALG